MARSKRKDSRARSVVYCGLVIALMTVTAWITIPIGVVPVTLQVFVVVFALLVLTPKQYFMSLVVYVLIGAVGLPVFSGMRGGLGVLMGPTGGFVWGWFLAAALALLVRYLYLGMRSRQTLEQISKEQEASLNLSLTSKRGPFLLNVVEVGLFLTIMYLCGWIQLMVVAGLDPMAAFVAGIAPFIVLDIVKAVFAVTVAEAVKRALPQVKAANRES